MNSLVNGSVWIMVFAFFGYMPFDKSVVLITESSLGRGSGDLYRSEEDSLS